MNLSLMSVTAGHHAYTDRQNNSKRTEIWCFCF